MPKDSSGKFHLNAQRASSADKSMSSPKPKHNAGIDEPGSDANSTTLHDNGDGTFKTSSPGGKEEQHPNIGHAVTHIAAKHSAGKHMHLHHDAGSINTNKSEGGQVDGPNDHEDSQGAADEVNQYFSEGGQTSHEPMEMSHGSSLHGL